MSGGRGSPRVGKVKIKVKVVLYRPEMNERRIWTTFFMKRGFAQKEVQKKLERKYLKKFPSAYVFSTFIKETVR